MSKCWKCHKEPCGCMQVSVAEYANKPHGEILFKLRAAGDFSGALQDRAANVIEKMQTTIDTLTAELAEAKQQAISYRECMRMAEDQLAREQQDNRRLREALERIANFVRWGVVYRGIAREALEGDASIDLELPAGMAFDDDGEVVTDYGPEHDPDLAASGKDGE